MYFIILTLTLIGCALAQSPSSGLTTNLRLKMYAEGARGIADSINWNWQTIDAWVADSTVRANENNTFTGDNTFTGSIIASLSQITTHDTLRSVSLSGTMTLNGGVIDFGTPDNAPLRLPYLPAGGSALVTPRSFYMLGESGIRPRLYYYDMDSEQHQIAVLDIPNTWNAVQTFDTLVSHYGVTIDTIASRTWVNSNFSGSGASALNDLTDVVISSPSNGQFLKYNGSNWVNATSSASVANLSDIATHDTLRGNSIIGDNDGNDDDIVVWDKFDFRTPFKLPQESGSLFYDVNTIYITAGDLLYYNNSSGTRTKVPNPNSSNTWNQYTLFEEEVRYGEATLDGTLGGIYDVGSKPYFEFDNTANRTITAFTGAGTGASFKILNIDGTYSLTISSGAMANRGTDLVLGPGDYAEFMRATNGSYYLTHYENNTP